MEDAEVSYETLQELLRQERRSNRLTPLSNGFWARLQAFLKEIEADFREAQARDPFDRKVMMMTDRIKNARHAAESFWTLRERKIAMIAMAHVRDGGEPEGLTAKELDLYQQLTAIMRAGRRDIFAGTDFEDDYEGKADRPVPAPNRLGPDPNAESKHVPTPRPPVAPEPSVAEPPAEAPPAASPPATPPATPAPEPVITVPADTPDADVVMIRALDQIPPFVGPDMQTYHLAKGDLATVPKGIADVLVKRKKAARVEAEDPAINA